MVWSQSNLVTTICKDEARIMITPYIHKLIALEVLDFFTDCIKQGMDLADIVDAYLPEKSVNLTYGAVLQALIADHRRVFISLAKKDVTKDEY